MKRNEVDYGGIANSGRIKKMYVRGLKTIAVAVVAVSLAACSSSASPAPSSAGGGASPSTAGAGRAKIGLAISSFQNDFFVTLADGAKKAATSAGVELVIADAGGDASKQASQVEDFITQKVAVILLNPVDSDAIVPSVEKANAAKIPVVTVDRGASGGDVVSHIASDNVAGGKMAGEYLFTLMGGSGKVIELEGISGTSAARDRGQGFQQALDAVAGKIERVAKQTANFKRDEGLSVAQNLLQANPDATGLFAHNDDMALGAVEAVAAAGLTGKVFVVGFDAAPDAVTAIKDGKMDGTIAQQPALIGKLAIETAVKVANGETVEKAIPVEITLVNKDNVAQFLN
jgi:ribose transport system substrate-binding protein